MQWNDYQSNFEDQNGLFIRKSCAQTECLRSVIVLKTVEMIWTVWDGFTTAFHMSLCEEPAADSLPWFAKGSHLVVHTKRQTVAAVNLVCFICNHNNRKHSWLDLKTRLNRIEGDPIHKPKYLNSSLVILPSMHRLHDGLMWNSDILISKYKYSMKALNTKDLS